MKVGLLTDAPLHNLALMRLAAWHKAVGDEVVLGGPADVQDCDFTYGSYLFGHRDFVDNAGGPGVEPSIRLAPEVEAMKPDYDLYPQLPYCLGHTWEWCPRRCGFCVVPKQHNPKTHRSIWEFHDSKFTSICLLNNNTFSDPQWKATFAEILAADLTVVDHNGYDLRLIDEEKAFYLSILRFQGYIHFAWDRMRDERAILRGLAIAKEYGLNKRAGPKSSMVYVLIGYDTTIQQDIYRCQRVVDAGFDPYIMIYNRRRYPKHLNRFRRFINNTRYYRRHRTVEEAWQNYRRGL